MNQTSATSAAAHSAATTAPPSTAASVPTTPSFVRKFQSNFRPLDLRKITLYGYGSQSQDESLTSISSSTVSCATQSSSSSSSSGSASNGCTTQECTPKRERKQLLGAHHTYHSSSQDSFMLKRQSSQNRLRESLLASLLSPRFVSKFNAFVCVCVQRGKVNYNVSCWFVSFKSLMG